MVMTTITNTVYFYEFIFYLYLRWIDRSALCLIQRAKIIQANIKNTSFLFELLIVAKSRVQYKCIHFPMNPFNIIMNRFKATI